MGSLGSSLLLLDVLRHKLFVSLGGLLGVGVAGLGLSLDGVLAAKTLLGDHALDFGGLVESLVTALDLTTDDVVAHIILLLVKVEGLDNVSATLGTEAVGAGNVGDTVDFLFALLDDAEEDGGEIGAGDASADGLALAFSDATGLETLAT